MKGRRGAAFCLRPPFSVGAAVSFVIPILYVQPYFRMSLAVCSKWILDESVEARRAEILMPVPFEDAARRGRRRIERGRSETADIIPDR